MVCLAVVVAIVLRLWHVYVTRDMPTVRHLIGDAAGYFGWAERIAGGAWIGNESFYQAPLYPYVLAVVIKAFGVAVGSVRIVQSLWIGLAVWCVYLGTSRWFNRRCGLLAAWMLALYAPSVFFDGIVQKASLGCLLLCGLVALLARKRKPASGIVVLAAGVLSGLLVLTRENAMVWLPIIGGWIWLSRPGSPLRMRVYRLSGYALGVLLVLGPVGVRNARVAGQWSLSTFQAGPNFYIGNHHGANGRYVPLVRGHETPVFERRDATRLAEGAEGRTLSPREVSRYWMSRAWYDMRGDPGSWLALMGKKLLMVVHRHEVADAEDQYVCAEFSPVLQALGLFWHFGVLFPLASVGLVLTRHRWRELWLLYALVLSMVLAVAAFYVMARYRYPLVPLLIPLAAVGCADAWTCIRSRAYRPLLMPVMVGAVLAVAVNVPIYHTKALEAHSWMNIGVALAEDGDLAGATSYFRRAVEGHPASAEANNNLAQALAMQGDFRGAISHYEAALATDAALMGVDFNLAVALERIGRTSDALVHFERASELDPGDRETKAAIERLRGVRR